MIFTLTTTKLGAPCVEMHDADKTLVAKMYPSANFQKFRIVFPELVNFKQTLICPDQHFIEFTRDARGGLPHARRKINDVRESG